MRRIALLGIDGVQPVYRDRRHRIDVVQAPSLYRESLGKEVFKALALLENASHSMSTWDFIAPVAPTAAIRGPEVHRVDRTVCLNSSPSPRG